MPRNYISPTARCPYYRGERTDAQAGGAALFCAGVGESENIRLFFRSKDKLNEHCGKLCRAGWEECAIAQLLQNNQGEK